MKQFKPTSWSVNNKTSIYVLVVIIMLFGLYQYGALQKEKFPDIAIPTIMVSTIYPGNSPADMENLVTRPLEKQMKGLSGVKKITSTSGQDFSIISVEFNANENLEAAKQRVKDAIDKASTDLPNDLPAKPNAMDINISDMPILYVNLSGDFDNAKLKKFADDIKDRVEALKEIKRADIVGALDREIQIDLDLYKAAAAKITFNDVYQAVKSENVTISAGSIRVGDMQRNIRIVGEYKDPLEIGNIIVRTPTGGSVYLRDIATIKNGFADRKSFATLDNKPVVTLNIVKRAGENLIDASDKIQAIVKEMHGTVLPKSLKITLTGDQSNDTRNTLNDLINTIVIGFILVLFILMFFMGTTNAFFVALSVPLSTFVAFLCMPIFGGLIGFSYTLNMMVLFSFLLALGIVVDDAIVVIENTHRIYHQSHMSILQSAKAAAGEVFIPVLAGTLTTLAPFFPLLFWPGIVGKFMYFLPLTLIIVLTASLLVAFIINPVFAVSFMKREHGEGGENAADAKRKSLRTYRRTMIFMGAVALLFGYFTGNIFFGNVVLFIALFITLNRYVFNKWIKYFQEHMLPRFQDGYARLLSWALRGRHPYGVLFGTFGVLILSFVLTGILKPKVEFFPSGDPKFIYVYMTLPVGTDVNVTDSVTQVVQDRVYKVIGHNNPDVESVISNVAIGAGDPQDPMSSQALSNKGRVQVAFKEFAERTGPKTSSYMNKIRDAIKGIPGAEFSVEQEHNGPPTGKPISVEISGDNIDTLTNLSKRLKAYINRQGIQGIEELRSDLDDQNPELEIDIDRERANSLGLSTGQIAMEIRTALLGFTQTSKYKEGEDQYPIQVRYSKEYRDRLDALMNDRITFREMSSGQIKQIPISAVATVRYENTFGTIRRKNLKKIVTLSSNVVTGYNANEIVGQIQNDLKDYKAPDGYTIKMGGEQEDQKETMNFLGFAGLMAICLIAIILVTQFNSVSKPVIILTEIFFSLAGVFLGFSIFHMTISIVMTGVGIVALAGIVVKNGILLVEFADVLKEEGHRTIPAIVQAGRTRLNPVILTATATTLGLVPLALGMNINFYTLFAQGNPHFYIGGESVTFWGPLAWTIIFGLTFATFLTLVVVPSMYLINYKWKVGLKRRHILSREHKM
jgi:multidrug efflux pump subunit AcrB